MIRGKIKTDSQTFEIERIWVGNVEVDGQFVFRNPQTQNRKYWAHALCPSVAFASWLLQDERLACFVFFAALTSTSLNHIFINSFCFFIATLIVYKGAGFENHSTYYTYRLVKAMLKWNKSFCGFWSSGSMKGFEFSTLCIENVANAHFV